MANDNKVNGYTRNRIGKLEQELRSAQSELDILRARPAPATQREDYVLGEMELVNRQLECKYSHRLVLRIFAYACSVDSTCVFTGFVPDFQAEQTRIEERLDHEQALADNRRLAVSIFGLIGFEPAHSPH